MHIGQISELSGFSQRMIRFLEDQGLIAPRSEANQREFNNCDLARVLRIRGLKDLGFTYSEIKNLINGDDALLKLKSSELLMRHRTEAQELSEKIQRLEELHSDRSYAPTMPDKMTNMAHPPRTVYRMKKMDAVYNHLKSSYPELKSEITLWKFQEFLNFQTLNTQEIEVIEIFRGSSQIVVLHDQSFLSKYEKAWQDCSLPLYSNKIGKFPGSELSEFFGNYEIILEHRIFNQAEELIFQALLPYQAIFIASGEAGLSVS